MASKKDTEETVEFLRSLKYNDLRSLAKGRGLKASGAKADLVARLHANNAKADACNDAENAADVDQVDDGMLVKDNDAPAAASTVPVTSEDPVRESKLDVERPTEHVAMPSADSTPPATRDICEMETDVDSDSLVKQDATSAEVTTTQAICEGTRPDEGEADSEDASTPAAKNDTSTTCKRRRDEHVSLPATTVSSEHPEGDVNDGDRANEFKGGAIAPDVKTSKEATMASADGSAQRGSHQLSQKVETDGEQTAKSSAAALMNGVTLPDTATNNYRRRLLETVAPGVTPSRAKHSASVANRPSPVSTQKASPSSRFERAHQNLFAGQRSIEAYGRTPQKSGIDKENTSNTRAASKTQVASKTIARALASSSASGAISSAGSGLARVKKGKTVASKPCTLVIKPSTRKPTQVKAFSLSSGPGKREGFKFKPYSGRVQPIKPVLGALADRTSNPNVLATTSVKKQTNPRDRSAVKATLASGKAQMQRRATHFSEGKKLREKKLAERRVMDTS